MSRGPCGTFGALIRLLSLHRHALVPSSFRIPVSRLAQVSTPEKPPKLLRDKTSGCMTHAQIPEAVVCRVTILVAAFPAFGTGAGERLQDEAVHVAGVLPSAPDQADGEVAAVLRGGLQGAPSVPEPGRPAMAAPARFDDSIAADPVAAETVDQSAFQIHVVMYVKMKIFLRKKGGKGNIRYPMMQREVNPAQAQRTVGSRPALTSRESGSPEAGP